MLLGIKRHQFVHNDEVWRLTGQPKLIEIVQSRCLTLFGHIARMGNNTDAKRILSALPPEDWRSRGRPRITWLSIIQQDLRSHNLTLPEAMDMAQNWSLWRMWLTYGVDVWCSSNALVSINAVALHRASLVLGWVTAFGQVNCLIM